MSDEAESERFVVVDGSVLGHCCIDATVVDTSRGKGYCENIVCECLTPEDAQLIADALNASVSHEKAALSDGS